MAKNVFFSIIYCCTLSNRQTNFCPAIEKMYSMIDDRKILPNEIISVNCLMDFGKAFGSVICTWQYFVSLLFFH
jgi:hypothetical protein